MALFKIERAAVQAAGKPADLFRVGFGDPAANDAIVREVEDTLRGLLDSAGGGVALLNGPAFLPVAVQLAHGLLHRYAVLGVFDPKLAAYVIAASHGSDLRVGDLIPAAAVQE